VRDGGFEVGAEERSFMPLPNFTFSGTGVMFCSG
jgi:hypothetical protein